MESGTNQSPSLRRRMRIVCGLAATLLGIYTAVAEESPRGHLVRVPLPIVGSVDDTVRRSIRRLLADGSGQADRPLLVLEFWPTTENESSEADGSEFERSLSLLASCPAPNSVRCGQWLICPARSWAMRSCRYWLVRRS